MGRFREGKHIAIARSWDFGLTNNNTEQVAVEFEILEGEDAGEFITWYGFFTDDTEQRTLEALRYCGWTGDDVTELAGMGSRKVSLDIGDENYEGKTHSRVKWVNRFGGNGVRLKKTMDAPTKRMLAARLRAKAQALPPLPPEPTQAGATAAAPTSRPSSPPPAGTPPARGNDTVGPERFDEYQPPPRFDDDIPF